MKTITKDFLDHYMFRTTNAPLISVNLCPINFTYKNIIYSALYIEFGMIKRMENLIEKSNKNNAPNYLNQTDHLS
jgi:hypothetical protein